MQIFLTSLEKAMATHSCTLAWKIPWTEEPGRLQTMGSLRLTRLSDFTFTFHFHALEKEMVTHSGILAWRIPWPEEPCRLQAMGSQRVGHDWATSLSLFFSTIHLNVLIRILRAFLSSFLLHSKSNASAYLLALPWHLIFRFWPLLTVNTTIP